MKIFLSSTYQDLVEYRAVAAEALERLGQQGVRMEVFGARPADATTASLSEISESNALVGIYAHRYGHIPKGQSISITEQEFEFARSNSKPTFCFLVDPEQPCVSPAPIPRDKHSAEYPTEGSNKCDGIPMDFDDYGRGTCARGG
jgi:Domain of unknown function (DUF4062)